MAPSLHDAFLHEVEAFLAATGMSASAFGGGAVGDRAFVSKLRKDDRSPSLKTADRVRSFMASEQWQHE